MFIKQLNKFWLLCLILLAACSGASSQTTIDTSTVFAAASTATPLSISEQPTDESVAEPTAVVAQVVTATDTPVIPTVAVTEIELPSAENPTTATLSLSGDTIILDGSGATIDGSTATITQPGSYTLQGTLSDGRIIVDSQGDVELVLADVEISNSTTAPIFIANAETVTVQLVDGSNNILTDATTYIYPDAETNEPNAALFSNDDLFITGNGSLTVNGNYNDAITSEDGLVIVSGNITANAADDGIRGKDYLVVQSGNITVNAGGDGLKADNEEDAERGYILIEDGTLIINAGGDAITAETTAQVVAGALNLTTGGGSGSFVSDTTSMKGIKAGQLVMIDGGVIGVNSADDSLHSNANITINAGTLTLASGDDGIHADTTLEINDGTIAIQQSYEGLEAAAVIVNGGTIDIVSSDDGINGAGGNADTTATTGGRQDRFSSSSGTITINGGTITISAATSGNGDGLDANGELKITGGDLVIKVPTTYRDYSNIDYDTTFSWTGGTVQTLDANGNYADVPADGGGRRGRPGGGRP